MVQPPVNRQRIIVTGVQGRKAGHRPAGPVTAEPRHRAFLSDIYVARNYNINKFVVTRLSSAGCVRQAAGRRFPLIWLLHSTNSNTVVAAYVESHKNVGKVADAPRPPNCAF